MSYGFDMGFAPVESELDAYRKVFAFTKVLGKKENAQAWIDENCYCMEGQLSRANERDAYEILSGYLSKIFTVKFVYWPENKLLGISGRDWPDEAQALFPFIVYFQNSTDQDYEYETWDDRIPFFAEKKAAVMALSNKEVLQQEKKWGVDIDYHRKSLLYRKIVDELELMGWLYGSEGNKFTRLTLNAIETSEMMMYLEMYSRKILLDQGINVL